MGLAEQSRRQSMMSNATMKPKVLSQVVAAFLKERVIHLMLKGRQKEVEDGCSNDEREPSFLLQENVSLRSAIASSCRLTPAPPQTSLPSPGFVRSHGNLELAAVDVLNTTESYRCHKLGAPPQSLERHFTSTLQVSYPPPASWL